MRQIKREHSRSYEIVPKMFVDSMGRASKLIIITYSKLSADQSVIFVDCFQYMYILLHINSHIVIYFLFLIYLFNNNFLNNINVELYI